MRADSDIERDVKDELQWRPDLDATDIAVSVKNGVVTLTGFVHSYVDKFEAEAAAKHVAGVVGMANDIEVRLRNVDAKPDPEIAREAVAAIKSQLPYSWENIKVIVKDGWVASALVYTGTSSTLDGESMTFSSDAARWMVSRVSG